jgi:hypothetical protein
MTAFSPRAEAGWNAAPKGVSLSLIRLDLGGLIAKKLTSAPMPSNESPARNQAFDASGEPSPLAEG